MLILAHSTPGYEYGVILPCTPGQVGTKRRDSVYHTKYIEVANVGPGKKGTDFARLFYSVLLVVVSLY